MLTLVSLGLCDGRDITLRGKEAVDKAKHVYLESYTSLLQCTHEELEAQLGCKITRLSRANVESGLDTLLDQAKPADVVLLVIGEVFGATTHAYLYLRAKERGVETAIVHNASIVSAVGAVGLELYRFGRTISIPYWEKSFEPTSFLEYLKENQKLELHTLCLLDIKSEEGRYMTVNEAITQLQKADAITHIGVISPSMLVIGIARLGCATQKIVAGRLEDVSKEDFGPPPHSLIIPGKLHHVEESMLALWK